MRRWLKSVFVYASFTVKEISWRCSSTSSTATSASFRAASVAARFLPKSKRSCESKTWATNVSPNCLVCVMLTFCPAAFVTKVGMLLLVAPTTPLSCGKSGAMA